MKNVIYFLLFLLLTTPAVSSEIDDQDIRNIRLEIEKLAKGLPVIIDKETRLDSAALLGDTINILYSLLNYKSTDISFDMEKFLRSQVINGYCGKNKSTTLYRNKNLNLNVTYRGSDELVALEIIVTPTDCNKNIDGR